MKRAFILMAGLLAAGGAVRAMETGACKEDVEAFCKDVKPGEGRIVDCLKQHESQLSAGCKAQRAGNKEEAKELMKDCAADKEKFCKDVKPGEGRIIQCLKSHEAELAPACRDGMAKEKAEMEQRKSERKAERKAGMEACKGDVQQFCGGVQPGGGRIKDCLKQHEAQLSTGCKGAMTK